MGNAIAMTDKDIFTIDVGENVPVASIEPRVYGAMNAQKVLEMVDELLKDSK